MLPFLAPTLTAIGANSISRIIYFIYSWFCHQFHTRSLYLFDQQCAWCARDTGIWAGVLISSWAYLKGYVSRVRWFHLPIFILPILLDGGTQSISTLININQITDGTGEYFSNNFLRFVTGAWLGIGIGLWLVPNISEAIILKNKSKDEGTNIKIEGSDSVKTKNNHLKIIFIQLILILIYIFLVLLWNLTSQTIKPTNFLDSVPKKQEMFLLERRRDGECPTSGMDIFNFDCLLYGRADSKL